MKRNYNEDESQPFRESLLYQVIREWFSDLTILWSVMIAVQNK